MSARTKKYEDLPTFTGYGPDDDDDTVAPKKPPERIDGSDKTDGKKKEDVDKG